MKKSNSLFVETSSILSDGLYHDGDTIGKKLNVTRSAVWKVIKKLEEYGVKITSIKGKGYAMSDPLILINKNLILNNLSHKDMEIEIFESIDSTNTYLKSVAKKKNPRVCIAESQTSGRGRLNREWYSPFGKNIYLSLGYSFEKDMSALAGLSMVVGLSIIQALKYLNLKEPLLLKWPNDVIIKNRKLSGSLIEIDSEANGLSDAIIGVGLNVNMTHENEKIKAPWISLHQMLNHPLDRNQLCASLINWLMKYLTKFEKEGFLPFKKEWEEYDSLFDKNIKLASGKDIIKGVARGINEYGHLKLEVEKGYIRTFSSGDTTILKK